VAQNLNITDVKVGTYLAQFGEMVLYNPSGGPSGGFSIILPVPSGNINREVGIKSVSDSTVTMTVIATGVAKLDDSPYDLVSYARASRIYKSIGTGYIII
jgi:hypothetical protein